MALKIVQIPAHTNNYGKGRDGKKITKIVLHWIVGTLESADATFQKPTRKASAHYGVGDLDIHQYVKEEDTAWHAGNLSVNKESIGIETEGGWESPAGSGKRVKPSEQTHKTTAVLVADIAKRYNIPLDRDHIKKHSEVSDKATSCCGTLDIDLIIEIAKEINYDPGIPPINVKEDIPSYYEDILGLKSYPWYDKHFTWVGMFTQVTEWWNDSKKLKEIEEILESTEIKYKEAVAELEQSEADYDSEVEIRIKFEQENAELKKENEELKNIVWDKPENNQTFTPSQLYSYLAGLFRKK